MGGPGVVGDVVNDRDEPAIQVVHPWYRPHAEIIHSNEHIPVPYVRTAEVRPLIEGAIRVGVDLKPGRSEGLHDVLAVIAGDPNTPPSEPAATPGQQGTERVPSRAIEAP